MNGITTRRGIPMVVSQVVFGAAMLLAWQGLVTAGIMDKFFFSRPSDIGLRVWQWISAGTVWAHLAVTILRLLSRLRLAWRLESRSDSFSLA